MQNRDRALADLIAVATNQPLATIVTRKSLSGGCVHRAELIQLQDGRSFFVKSNRQAGDMFAQEAYGLTALAHVGMLKTPQVIAMGCLAQDEQCLVLEAILHGPARTDFWTRFGAGLAEHHRRSTAQSFGWSSDNYLGSSLQKNEARDNWSEFFADCRLGPQVQWARKRGVGSTELFRLSEKLLGRLDQWLGGDVSPPCLLHGDLWSGNYLVGADGHAVVLDPAVYYGSREAELAMPLLFGGFPPEFFDAYMNSWPLQEGWQERVELVKLYHLFNHLNLFGVGYLDSCLEILKRFAS